MSLREEFRKIKESKIAIFCKLIINELILEILKISHIFLSPLFLWVKCVSAFKIYTGNMNVLDGASIAVDTV